MPASILATKLYIPPPRSKVVLRPRLIARLNEGLQRAPGVTLISAPAGFGKTTLVSEWIDDCRAQTADWKNEQTKFNPQPKIGNPKFAWLSLDEGDNDPARFLMYLVAALQTVWPQIGASVLATLQSPQSPPTEALLTALLNEITGLPDRVVLVLDDYHALDSPPIDLALTFLIDHLPPQLHLVIATREDPSIPLARLRARGQLTELRAADLRFMPAEAAEFLNHTMGLGLSADDVAVLESRTEGWIAGLQLAALSMQRRSDAANFIQAFTGSHRFVLDYLMEEVLQRQPERVRNFLLQTSVLDRLCGALCDSVTDRADGRRLLETLEHDNLFVAPLDDQRQWYRYHHLFADVLRARLMEEQPDRVSTLHQRASAWYEQNDLPADAVRHALAAEDVEHAADLIERAWSAIEESSQTATWLGWMKALPDEIVRARPVLCVGYAYALLGGGELEAAEARLRDAERWLEPADNVNKRPDYPAVEMVVVDEGQFRSLPATIAVARAYLAQALGDVAGTVKYAQRVLDLLPEGDHLRRGQATALLGLTYWANGDLEAANRTFADFVLKLRAAGNIPDAISATFVLADIRLALGRLREAVSTFEQLLQFVVGQGEPIPPDTADLFLGLGDLCREQGDLEAAVQHLLKSKELGEQAELLVWRYRWCIAQARLNETQGDLAGALDLLDEAERLFIRTPLPDLRPISAMKARIWVAQGKLTEALAWALERSLAVDDAPSYLREFEHITLARMLIAHYQSNRDDVSIYDALKLLERLLKAAEEGRRLGSVIEILVLQALAYQAQGNVSLARAPLERALSLAEPEGYVRLFVDEGEAMRLLIVDFRSLIERRGNREDLNPFGYTAKLLAAFPQPAALQSEIKNQKSEMIEPLSPREVEILRLIAQGLSNREIGERLYLALDTVKGHNRRIFDKLQVKSRTEAIARARELGLL